MKRKISLMPKEGKKKQEIKKMQKVGVIIGTIPLIVSIYNYGFNIIKTEELERIKENQRQANIIKSEISTEVTTKQENEAMLRNLQNNGFPLNKFMLFVGTQIPSDIRIYEITRGEVSSPKKEETGVNIQVETNLPNYEGLTNEQSGTEGMSLSEEMNMGTEDTNTTTNESNENQTPEANENITRDNKVIIKGAGLRVDSIAKFVDELKNNSEYVEKIELSDVRNYNNSQFNYKLFEMVIYLR